MPRLFFARRCSGYKYEAERIFSSLLQENDFNESHYIRIAAKLHMANYEWAESLNILSRIVTPESPSVDWLICLAEGGRDDKIETYRECESFNSLCFDLIVSYARRDWSSVASIFKESFTLRAFRHLVDLKGFRENAEAFKSLVSDPRFFIEIAQIEMLDRNWQIAIDAWLKAYPEVGEAAPLCDGLKIAETFREGGDYERADLILEQLSERFGQNPQIAIEKAELAEAQLRWFDAMELWGKLKFHYDSAPYRMAGACRNLGDIEGALTALTANDIKPPSTVEEWILVGEVASLAKDWPRALNAWESLLRAYPVEAPQWVWDRWQVALLFAGQANKNAGGQQAISK